MKMIRLFSGNDGQSHFEDIEIKLAPVHVAHFSMPFATDNIRFGRIEGVDEISWHTQDEPCYIVILQGSMELEIGDGTKQVLKAGDILLAEDTTGQGHITRSINGQGWKFLIAPAKK
ncbi:MAG: hypothetical protein A3E87_10810 [Gammaproteobacteria bacterium RIFCSPHIGHO2_12_FULL_35_23]|nr:MAG: hypothetical protein A3E87_10810 [Gammaproteobacteria bacterium RIFCSPHIGHO2_12_FULL_35_23]